VINHAALAISAIRYVTTLNVNNASRLKELLMSATAVKNKETNVQYLQNMITMPKPLKECILNA
jgi:hypothetical protein